MEPGSLSPALPSPTKKSSQELPFYPIDVQVQEASPTAKHSAATGTTAAPGLHDQVRLSVIADGMDVDNGTTAAPAPAPTQAANRSQMKTPELQTMQQIYTPGSSQQAPGSGAAQGIVDRSPSTPGHIPAFDWDEFEARYEQALGEMNGQEKELLEEFDRLINYFNVWASAAAAHDDERAVKRLQTRERYVKIAEQSLGQRKQHLTEVVRAFQSALALLSQP